MVQIPVEVRNCLLSKNVQICSRAHIAPCSMSNGAPSLGVKWPGVMLSTHLHLMLKLRMNGATLLHFHGVNREKCTLTFIATHKFDVCLSVHRSISVEKKTNYMLLNALLQL